MRRNIVLWLGRYVTVVGPGGTLVDVVAGDAVAIIASGVASAGEGSIGVGAEGAGLLHTTDTTRAAVSKCSSRQQNLHVSEDAASGSREAEQLRYTLADFDCTFAPVCDFDEYH